MLGVNTVCGISYIRGKVTAEVKHWSFSEGYISCLKLHKFAK